MLKHRSSSPLLGSLLVVLSLGCGEPAAPTRQSSPPTPPTPTATGGLISGYVVDASGGCVSGAVVEIVAGPGVGRKSNQSVPCTAWSYGGGYEFRNLPLDATVTLRATAPGYQSQDRQVVVGNGGPP